MSLTTSKDMPRHSVIGARIKNVYLDPVFNGAHAQPDGPATFAMNMTPGVIDNNNDNYKDNFQ